jgi:peptidyl-prolyl cis-trans isomerase SurA
MSHNRSRALLAGVVLLAAGTALAQTRNVEEIVAWVNNDIILKSEYETRKAQIREDLAQPAPRGRGLQGAQLEQAFNEQSKRVLQSLIDETLLLQQAKEMGLTADNEIIKTKDRLRLERKLATLEELEQEIVAQGFTVEEFNQNIRVQYLSSQVMQREVYPRVIVTNEEVRKYYDSHVKEFDRPAGVRIRESTVITENRGPEETANQRKKAEEALEALKKGDDFAAVAAKYSESQTSQEGGDLGFFVKGELAEVLEQVADKLEKAQFSDIITVPGAFMIIKLDDKHPGGILPFELAQKEVFEVLWQQAVRPKMTEYLTKLRADGFVKTAEGFVDTGASPKDDKVSEAKE